MVNIRWDNEATKSPPIVPTGSQGKLRSVRELTGWIRLCSHHICHAVEKSWKVMVENLGSQVRFLKISALLPLSCAAFSKRWRQFSHL